MTSRCFMEHWKLSTLNPQSVEAELTKLKWSKRPFDVHWSSTSMFRVSENGGVNVGSECLGNWVQKWWSKGDFRFVWSIKYSQQRAHFLYGWHEGLGFNPLIVCNFQCVINCFKKNLGVINWRIIEAAKRKLFQNKERKKKALWGSMWAESNFEVHATLSHASNCTRSQGVFRFRSICYGCSGC